MSEELSAAHVKQWDEYNAQAMKLREELDHEHFKIEEAFDFDRRRIPEVLQIRMERERQAWIDEYGVKGSRTEALKKEMENEWDEANAQAKSRLAAKGLFKENIHGVTGQPPVFPWDKPQTVQEAKPVDKEGQQNEKQSVEQARESFKAMKKEIERGVATKEHGIEP